MLLFSYSPSRRSIFFLLFVFSYYKHSFLAMVVDEENDFFIIIFWEKKQNIRLRDGIHCKYSPCCSIKYGVCWWNFFSTRLLKLINILIAPTIKFVKSSIYYFIYFYLFLLIVSTWSKKIPTFFFFSLKKSEICTRFNLLMYFINLFSLSVKIFFKF